MDTAEDHSIHGLSPATMYCRTIEINLFNALCHRATHMVTFRRTYSAPHFTPTISCLHCSVVTQRYLCLAPSSDV